MKQNLTELKGETDKFIIRAGDFSIPFRISRITIPQISENVGEV
jgi:hypothetical protein